MTRRFGLLTIALALLDVAILATLSAYNFDLNDNMYAAAPLTPGALYREVHFVQGPVTFYFLKAVSAVLPEGFVYLGLRLTSMGLLLAALYVGTFMCIDRWSSRCLFLAFAGTNIYFIYPGLEIGSYSLPLLLLALAAASLWKIRDRQIAIGAAALLIGLAASAKLNHVLFFLPLAVFVLLQKRKDKSVSDWARAALLPFAAGGLAGSLPVIVAFAQSPGAFLLNTLIFHSKFSLNALNIGSFASFMLTLNLFTDWAAAGGAVLVALGIHAAFVDRDGDERSRHFVLFALIGIVAALVAAISPGVTYVQYWAPVTFFAALAGARFFDRTRANLGLICVLAVLPLFTVGARDLRSQVSNNFKAASGTPKVATVISVNRTLKTYALRVNDTPRCDRRIFSLAGAFVVDSGFSLSRYMEGGTFWSWVSPQVPQAYIADKNYHLDEYMIFPERWVRDQRINFLLLGYYPGHTEEDLEKYASERGFSVVALPAWTGLALKFYFNPECIRS
jgi:hypothetical protein